MSLTLSADAQSNSANWRERFKWVEEGIYFDKHGAAI